MEIKNYFAEKIKNMAGYTPGEQPKLPNLIKLNTNENPYPPSPVINNVLNKMDISKLRLYPDPNADHLCSVIADLFNLKSENILAGNGSDDILTIAVRSFLNEGELIFTFYPTYSLYPVLAEIQGANIFQKKLPENFQITDDFIKNLIESDEFKKAKLFIIARPNAPTGNSFPKKLIEIICDTFNGIVLIDEAYADFSEDNCIDFIKKYKNVLIVRTMSKSYSLAGLRVGWAMADKDIITGMYKVKDSYNVSLLAQIIASEALKDRIYFNKGIRSIKETREKVSESLCSLGFTVIKSSANFLFVSPPNASAVNLFQFLRNDNIVVRYFYAPMTDKYLRITVGTEQEMDKLLASVKKYLNLS